MMKAKAKHISVSAYLRVSTKSQNLAGQRKGIKDWLRKNNIPESSVKWYQDKKTGTRMDRSALQRMMRAVDKSNTNMVVCYSLNRLARSLHHGVGLIQTLCEKNVRVVSVTEQLDFSGIIGQIIAAVMFGLAQSEVEGRRLAIIDGMAAAKANGKHCGRPRNVKKLARIRFLYDDGMSAQEIAAKMKCSRANIYFALEKTKGDDSKAA